VIGQFGKIDCLINGAGGNKAAATTGPDLKFFDLPADALRWVFDLNILGTMLPCQAFGKVMAEQGHGIILNISSMNSFRPLTRIPAYSGAKAAVSNFTQWLAVHMAQEYSPKIRVNAVAPGFFLTNQNRFLLTDKETGELTKRGNQIIAHTPMARFGEPKDLFGAVLWLLSRPRSSSPAPSFPSTAASPPTAASNARRTSMTTMAGGVQLLRPLSCSNSKFLQGLFPRRPRISSSRLTRQLANSPTPLERGQPAAFVNNPHRLMAYNAEMGSNNPTRPSAEPEITAWLRAEAWLSQPASAPPAPLPPPTIAPAAPKASPLGLPRHPRLANLSPHRLA